MKEKSFEVFLNIASQYSKPNLNNSLILLANIKTFYRYVVFFKIKNYYIILYNFYFVFKNKIQK